IKVTPRRTARCNTRTAVATSGGSPQTPRPVTRIAPKPRRLTLRSAPSTMCPAAAAFMLAFMGTSALRASKSHAERDRIPRLDRRSAYRQPRRAGDGAHGKARLHAHHARQACQMLAVDALEIR